MLKCQSVLSQLHLVEAQAIRRKAFRWGKISAVAQQCFWQTSQPHVYYKNEITSISLLTIIKKKWFSILKFPAIALIISTLNFSYNMIQILIIIWAHFHKKYQEIIMQARIRTISKFLFEFVPSMSMKTLIYLVWTQ